MKIKSLDPRVSRLGIEEGAENPQAMLNPHEHWPTYEVFHQKKRGTQHIHVGIVHAPSDELALVFAKEQYGRRGETTNIWVVKTEYMMVSDYADSDVFETTPEKIHREASGYSVKAKIDNWIAKQKEHAG